MFEKILKMILDWIVNSMTITDAKSSAPELAQQITDVVSQAPKVVIHDLPEYGEKGEHVGALQTQLNKNGAKLTIDNDYGPATKTAVGIFQKAKGLSGSGIVGPKTLELLNIELTISPNQPVGGSGVPSINITGTRNLEKKLENIVDVYLLKKYPNDLRNVISKKDGNKIVSLYCKTMTELDVREKTNHNDGEMVELNQETIGGHSNESWCMAQYQSAVAYAERKLGIKSRIPASESTVTTATDCPKDMKLKVEDSIEGCAWIWQHGTKWEGHVGCFEKWFTDKKVGILNEGNTTSGTDPNGKIVSEGGGSYATKRSINQIGDMHLIAIIRPFDKVT